MADTEYRPDWAEVDGHCCEKRAILAYVHLSLVQGVAAMLKSHP